MSDASRKAGNFIQNLSEALLPSPSAEKLIFRRFQGSKIADAVMYKTPINEGDIETVALRVNPQNVAFSKRKVIQKVQTSAPGRFVVFDWGSELTILNITGNTGLLLSSAITEEGIPFANTLDDVVAAAGATEKYQQAIGSAVDSIGGQFITPIKQNLLLSTSTYYETLKMSPKYNTFKKLETMFDLQDADSDIITLEFGDMAIYRGFFEEFSFEMSAESPWNWTYNITYIILADLTEKIRRWDKQFNRKNSNIQS
jgi:hypothetical protein